MPPSIITLTSDFGRADTYVAQMKGVILSINPAATIIDITHEIPPQDILRGSIVLEEMWQTFPVGTIHVAVVDPGVGTSRGILGAKCKDRVFVLPNNGLLSHVLKSTSADEIVEILDQSFWRIPVSSTFHGRDIMAPVAAHLSLGLRLGKLGPPAADVVSFDFQMPQFEERRLVGTIVSIDRFGNLITNIGLAHLRRIPTTEIIVCCKQQRIEGISRTYAEHPPGTLIALPSSRGHLELAIVGGDASLQLGAQISDDVALTW